MSNMICFNFRSDKNALKDDLSISDSVTADDISSVAVNVLDGGEFKGETSGEVMVG